MSEEPLSFQEVEKLLESILINKTLAQVRSKHGPSFVIFSHPSIEDTIRSRHVREQAILDAKRMGLPSKEDLEKELEKLKIFSEEDEVKIKDLEEKIKAQERLLQLTKIEGRKKEVLSNIDRISKELDKIKRKSRELLYMSAESKADEESLLFLCWVSTFSVEGTHYWENFQSFENEKDLYLRNSVIEAFMPFNAGLPVKTIRYLSRHNLWRIRYSTALKIGGPIFPRGLVDLSPDQLGLLYWSNYYQSIYEMLPDDQPDQDTINDDEALDAYMEAFFKRREEERNEGRIKRASGGNKKLSAWDRGEELIITPDHPEFLNMQYSDERVQAGDAVSEVEVIAPNSRRARNRAAIRRANRD